MFNETFIQIFNNVWPMCLITLTILVSLRVTYLLMYKPDYALYQELLKLLFIIYIMCLFYVVTFQDVSWSTSNFIPFKEILRYNVGSRSFFKNIAGNLIMFIPFGFFAGYYLKPKKVSPILLLSVLVSTIIETTQLLIGRVFDIDDIILNVLGGVLGYIIYSNIHWIEEHLPKALRKEWVYNIIMIVIIVIIVVYFGRIIIGG